MLNQGYLKEIFVKYTRVKELMGYFDEISPSFQ